jgi:molybdenum cofactor synthesis domain-containing protein
MSTRRERAVSAEILAIGNELLLGIVQDTNTHWLCAQITGLGGQVRRCVIVPDDLEAIGEELKRALTAQRDLIITTGGLGPTGDDMTLEALAQAVGVALKENPEALKMVARRYRELLERGRVDHAELTESRRKMAQLPQGAIPLYNQVGTAPGILLKHGRSLIVSLPGVPSELKDIFHNALQPYLKELFGRVFYREKTLIVEINDESRIAPLLREFQRSWPEVYIKSRPKGFDEGMKITITIAMSGERTRVEETLTRLLEELQERLRREGLPSVLKSSEEQ